MMKKLKLIFKNVFYTLLFFYIFINNTLAIFVKNTSEIESGLNTYKSNFWGSLVDLDTLTRFIRNILPTVIIVLGIIVIIYISAMFIISGKTEETQKEGRMWLIYVVVGIIILVLSSTMINFFNPDLPRGYEIDTNQQIISNLANQLLNFGQIAAGIIAFFFFLVAGYKLIMARGEENEVKTQTRNIVWSGVGLVIIYIAPNIIKAISEADTQDSVNIVIYLINLLVSLFTTFAIAFLVYGGYMMITSNDNSEKETKGKRIVIMTIIAMGMLYISYFLVNLVYNYFSS